MRNNKTTRVNVGEELTWNSFSVHRKVDFREPLNVEEANELGVAVSSILKERIEVEGAVLPHYHDVAEVIHITKGKVRLLQNGKWKSYEAGDTFIIPAGVVHAVVNDDDSATEQLSIFLPVSDNNVPNKEFKSYLVDDFVFDFVVNYER